MSRISHACHKEKHVLHGRKMPRVESGEINHAEKSNLPEKGFTPGERACISDHCNRKLAYERHYATFSFDTQFLNAALFNRITGSFATALSLSLCIVPLFVSSSLQTASGPLSFSSANESAACTFVRARARCVCVRAFMQLPGTRHRKLLKNRGALTRVVCDSFTRSHPGGRTCMDIFE